MLPCKPDRLCHRLQQCLQRRWEGAAQCGTAWLGQALDPVRIEGVGKFTFVLVKVENRQGSSRLLVRGRQNCTQAALMQDVENEVCKLLELGVERARTEL